MDLQGHLNGFENPLFFQGRDEYDGNVVEGGEAFADFLFHVARRIGRLAHQVPLVDQDDEALISALGQSEDAHVLGLHAGLGIDEQQTDIGIFEGSDGPHHRVKF